MITNPAIYKKKLQWKKEA